MIRTIARRLCRCAVPDHSGSTPNQHVAPTGEMISRVLINRDQKPWIHAAGARKEADMDELVRPPASQAPTLRSTPSGHLPLSVPRLVAQ